MRSRLHRLRSVRVMTRVRHSDLPTAQHRDDCELLEEDCRLNRSVQCLRAVVAMLVLPTVAVVALALGVPAANAQFPIIELSAISPNAVQVGTDFELKASHSDDAIELTDVFFYPGGALSTVQNSARADSSVASSADSFGRLSVAADAAPGIYEVRLLGRLGLSNPRALVVCRNPVEWFTTDHTSPAQAIELRSHRVYNGICQARQRVFFRVQLAKSDRLHVVGYSKQIDSQAKLLFVLFNPDRQEVARSRSVGAWPAEIVFSAPTDGDYVLAVSDFLFRGGNGFAFLLEANHTSGPELTAQSDHDRSPLELNELLRPALSLGDANLDETVLGDTAQGRAGESPQDDAQPQAPDGAHPNKTARHVPVSRFLKTSRFTTRLPFRQLSGDTIATASSSVASKPTTIPFARAGAFTGDQAAQFDFEGKKGQRLMIEVLSSALEQLTDPEVSIARVLNEGKQSQSLARQDDRPAIGSPEMRVRFLDPRLEWTVPEDGVYRITLKDNQTGSRPADATGYLLSVRESHPGFRLLAYRPFPNNAPNAARQYGSNLMRGGTGLLRIMVVREGGFSGPVELVVEGLPKSVSSEPMVVPPGATEASLILDVAEDAPAWTGSIRIRGTATIDNKPVEEQASSATVVWPTTGTHNTITSRLAGNIALCVNPADTAPIHVALGEGKTLEAKQGSKLTVPLRIQRRAGGQASCLLRPRDLPPKVTSGDITIPGDKTEGTVTLNIAQDAPIGEYTFWMQNETKVKWQTNPQSLTRAERQLKELQGQLTKASTDEAKSDLEKQVAGIKARIASLKKQTAPVERTVWLPTTIARIRIVSGK